MQEQLSNVQPGKVSVKKPELADQEVQTDKVPEDIYVRDSLTPQLRPVFREIRRTVRNLSSPRPDDFGSRMEQTEGTATEMDGAVIDDDMSQANMSIIKQSYESVIVEDLEEDFQKTPPKKDNNNMIEIMIEGEIEENEEPKVESIDVPSDNEVEVVVNDFEEERQEPEP